MGSLISKPHENWSIDYSPWFNNVAFQLIWMTIMWIICTVRNNGSMVDFGWPSGFTVMSAYFFLASKGFTLRKILICTLIIFAGLRFMYGWYFKRKHWVHEDPRWDLWRERWRKGEGWLGLRSVPLNFFFFYHLQSLSNALVFSFPLFLACNNPTQSIYPIEYFSVILWLVSFFLENVADFQLAKFKAKQAKLLKEGLIKTPGVCKEGLWKFSRHPNYFFEFMIWCSYSLFSLPSITEAWQYIPVAFQPYLAYYFLVHFTGAWMAEQSSLKKRGEEYRKYISSTNMIFPWFPKST